MPDKMKDYTHILIGGAIIFYFYKSGFKIADFFSLFMYQYFAVGSGIAVCLLRNKEGKSYIGYAILTVAIATGIFNGIHSKVQSNIIEQIRSIPLVLWLVVGLGGCVGYHLEKRG